MVSCVAYGCSNNSNKNKGSNITYHSFPKNEDLKRKWMNALKRKDWAPSKWSRVCSAHFKEADFDLTSLCCVRIREGAVPTIFSYISGVKEDLLHRSAKEIQIY
ncbi:THAP domain-containing protein 6-like [Homalodisca vitripennis]|uniref:THAP domain-containing protein 6-like n=1 Tax=Homalodisca vitripennis TaxID=197043 RepID=UPI001EEA28B4|nr:THAP domain-containing protein 6-like [Homalodisca vitripennis]